MTLASDLVSECEEHLLAGDREEMNELQSGIDNAQTGLSFTQQLNGLQPGSYISIDLEVMYVWSVSNTANSATVQRGMVGSTPAAHNANSLVYVNPRFSKYRMLRAINYEIADMSTPPNGLWQAKSFTLTTQPVSQLYAIPVANNDFIDLLDVRWIYPGATQRWARVWNRDITVMRNLPTTGSGSTTSGLGLRIEDQSVWRPGRTLRIVYAAPFTGLVNLTDDASTTGIPASALDIPPLGAAMRLMGVREAKRTFVESEVDTRRAGEVPVGSASKAAATLMSILSERIKSEYTRLVRQWPDAA